MAYEAEESVLRRVQDDARARLKIEARTGTNLSIGPRVLEEGEAIELPGQKIAIQSASVVVFADDAPLENWGHACRYLLYDPENGALVETVEALFPPDLVEHRERAGETFRAFHQPVAFARAELDWQIDPFPELPFWCLSDWYAVLFSGASNNRHTNDLEFLYRVLRQDYGVPAANIYVLNYDGTIDYSGGPHPVGNWPGDGTPYTMTVNAPGTKSELDAVLDDLKDRLGPEDNLLIHTNNHGGRVNNESTLIMYSGPDYTDADFGAKIAELPPHRCLMVMMEQCFAGGFNGPILANSPATYTSVASAAIATQTSIGGPDFDPFARDWISAMHRAAPDGTLLAPNPDSNGDGKVTAIEAFNYADAVHHPHDTPNYSESSTAAGQCYLGCLPPRFRIPELVKWPDLWLDPGPLRESFEKIRTVLPEIEEILANEIKSSARADAELQAKVRRLLR